MPAGSGFCSEGQKMYRELIDQLDEYIVVKINLLLKKS